MRAESRWMHKKSKEEGLVDQRMKRKPPSNTTAWSWHWSFMRVASRWDWPVTFWLACEKSPSMKGVHGKYIQSTLAIRASQAIAWLEMVW